MAFGERLQELRRARGMTQEDFAAQLKVSRQAVSKWESCRGYPELEKIIYICNRYGVTMNDLFCEEVPLGGQETPAAPERMESRTLKTALGDFVSNLSPANKWAGVGGLAAVTALVALCMLYLKGGGDSEMTALWIAAIVVFGVVEAVTCRAASAHPAEGEERFRVSLLDYGAKRNIVRELQKRGCTVTVLPAATSAEEVLAAKPDGVMLSNGPGDPAENVYQIEQIKKLLGKVPLFGICLGHQLTALAVGGGTYKLKYGHRGVNQPVRDLDGVRTYITSQNHGYAVDGTSLPVGKVRFINANDGTCEGIDYPDLRAFTVQFHPEACTGPKDTSFLFDQFVALMKGGDR